MNSEINALYHTFSLKAGMSDSESMILYLLFTWEKGSRRARSW